MLLPVAAEVSVNIQSKHVNCAKRFTIFLGKLSHIHKLDLPLRLKVSFVADNDIGSLLLR